LLSRDFMETYHPDRICRSARHHGEDRAREKSTLIYHDGNVFHFFSHEQPGRIAGKPAFEENTNDWKSFFVPEGKDRTYAEMSWEEKNEHSSYGKVLRQFLDYLNAPL